MGCKQHISSAYGTVPIVDNLPTSVSPHLNCSLASSTLSEQTCLASRQSHQSPCTGTDSPATAQVVLKLLKRAYVLARYKCYSCTTVHLRSTIWLILRVSVQSRTTDNLKIFSRLQLPVNISGLARLTHAPQRKFQVLTK